MAKANLLITGGAGFIGSNLVNYVVEHHGSDYNIIVLDALTYAGNKKHLDNVKDKIQFIKGDIRNSQIGKYIFEKHDIDHVIHLAAETHVDNSISNPKIFYDTNVMGTQNLIDAAYQYWKATNKEISKFLHVSTDEVYGSLGPGQYFSEDSPYLPNSPYSSSKAASDMIVRAYHQTYGMNTLITNCSNNYGPNQHSEKLIPNVVSRILSDQDIHVYGNGMNERDWLFVEDHCSAIMSVFHGGSFGQTYLIGTDNVMKNIDIVNMICDIMNKLVPGDKSHREKIKFVTDRLGHDHRYAINASMIRNVIGWKPKYNFNEALEYTIKEIINAQSNKI